MSGSKKDAILNIAEREMRRGGFDAVSFRDIANAVGIKSASVHYHFATKADLGQAVAKHYTERFVGGLGSANDPSEPAKSRIARLADAYLTSFRQERATCLCTVLGSVVSHLPDETTTEVLSFYDQLLAWVADALDGADTVLTPENIISALQGAMVLAIARDAEKPLLDARSLLLSAL